MADIQHSALTGAQLHEPKGADSATIYDTYVSNGAGSGAWKSPVRLGWWDYNDLTTATTPVALTLANTQYELTNDGAGSFTTSTYKLPDVTDVWDVATNRLDFSELSIGDVVDIRFDIEFTTSSVNTAIDLDVEFDIGGTPFQISIFEALDKKTAGTYKENHQRSFYIGSAGVRDNPARILASADKTGVTVKINGWFIQVHKRNEN